MIKNYPKWKYDNIIIPRFTALQKKARKFNVSLELKILENYWLPDDLKDVAVEWVEVELTGADLGIAGWTVVARIDHEETGNIVNAYSEMPEYYRTDKGSCDHCKTNRFRSVTYILQNEAGEYKQVGKTCLKDFFATDPAVLLFKERIHKELGEEDNYLYTGKCRSFSLESVLTAAAMIIRRHGYTSKAKAEEFERPSTKDYVFEYFSPADDSRSYREYYEKMYETPTDEDQKLANAVINWVKQLTASTDYQQNLQVIFNNEYVKEKYWGYVASAIPYYQKEMAIQIERANRPESNFIGNIGQRLELELTVTKIIAWDTQWGATKLYIMQDNQGNIVTWKTSSFNGLYSGIETDDKIKVKGTIKDHTLYNGIKQTELTRCTILKEAA